MKFRVRDKRRFREEFPAARTVTEAVAEQLLEHEWTAQSISAECPTLTVGGLDMVHPAGPQTWVARVPHTSGEGVWEITARLKNDPHYLRQQMLREMLLQPKHEQGAGIAALELRDPGLERGPAYYARRFGALRASYRHSRR